MKKIFLSFTILLVLLVVGASVAVVSPYYYYSEVLKNKHESEWYFHPEFKSAFLSPGEVVQGNSSQLGNDDLWSKFHFMDVVVPLPVQNPFFYVSPILAFDKKTKRTDFGLKLYDEGNREISKIFFIRNRLFPNVKKSQKIFSLPLVKKELNKYSREQIWKDIFSKKIEGWNIPFSEMIYNLYLIQLRSKILPEKFLSYSLVKGTSSAIIELKSKNKDYTSEMILTYSRGLLYSFILQTEKKNNESALVRYKLLNEVSFRGGSESLSNILYLEFKGLEYIDQIDHKGMLYLLSAWTHSMNNKSLVAEMVQSLEKGRKNQKQLESIYSYALKRYGTTFTTKDIDGLELSDEVKLRRNIEIEEIENDKRLKKQTVQFIEKKEFTEDEKLKTLLRKAKKNKKRDSGTIVID
jgi:hypothetical protein